MYRCSFSVTYESVHHQHWVHVRHWKLGSKQSKTTLVDQEQPSRGSVALLDVTLLSANLITLANKF